MLSELLLGVLVLEVGGILWCLRPLPPIVVSELAASPPSPNTPPMAVEPPVEVPNPGLSLHCGHTHHETHIDIHGLTHCPDCAAQRPHRFARRN